VIVALGGPVVVRFYRQSVVSACLAFYIVTLPNMPNSLAISQYWTLPLKFLGRLVCRIDTILDTTKALNVGLPPEPEGRDGRPGARRRVMMSEVCGIQQDPVSDAGIELPGSKESKTVITPGRHI
jgi:hypothetical protein